MNYEQAKIKEFYTVKNQVRMLLHEREECRNYDSILICDWLEEFKKITDLEQIRSEENKNISFETIRRARQLIQAKGDYLPTDETIIKRRRLQEIYQRIISQM